jgi:hypothetical protein
MKSKLLILFIAFGLLMAACEEEENDDSNSNDKVEANGFTEEINEFLPDSIINEMENLGMELNTGGNPPQVENVYEVTPFVLDSSNIPTDYPGMSFADFRFKLYDQNNEDLTVKLDYVNGPEEGTGLGSFIVGDNNQFTLVSEVTTVAYSDTAIVAMVFSGKMTDGGINDFYYANFMIENNGSSYFIENGQGRVIYDSDGFSEEISSLKVLDKNNITKDLKTVSESE